MSLLTAFDIHDPRQLDTLSEEQLHQLPCGAIRVDAEGVILFYSRSQGALVNREPAAVLGRNFFSEVAPCTVVPEFYGRFRRGVLSGHLDVTFEFVFDFEMHPVQVRITMRHADRPGEFWILVEPLQQLPPRDSEVAHALIADKFDAPGTGLAAVSFDFSRCDLEPIGTCGAIQPYGCLLVLDPETLRIAACSANTGMYLGLDPETLLGAPLERALAGVDETAPRACLHPPQAHAAACPALFQARAPGGDLVLDCRPHRWRGRLLLELEPAGEMPMDVRMRRFDFAAFQQRLMAGQEVAEVCQQAVQELRELTGFERVLVYRFEPDAHGVVIAEAVQEGAWPSVLGLHYPASDIPRQARALYRETPLRYAPSRDHADVPLLSRTLAVDAIDIGIAQLRAPSPIHRNYLERFGVNGSLSLSILLDDRLWGLVICHHRAPHPVTAAVRQRLIELVGLLSSRVALLVERERNQASEQGMFEVSQFVGEIDVERPFPENFADKEYLLRELVGADLVQIYHLGQPLFPHQDAGLTAAEHRALLAFLRSRPEPFWTTDCLSGEFEPAASYPEKLAGIMAIFVDDGREDLLLFGRRRVRYSVRWGADPSSLPFADTEGPRPLGWPNRVFQVWQEERTHHACPWSAGAIAVGHALKSLIQRVIVTNAAHFQRLSLALADQRDQLHQSREELLQARDAAESANRAKSAFLANMSHEVRTPLNGLLGLVQVLQQEPLSERQRGLLDRVQASGQALLGLLSDIIDLSQLEAGWLRLELRPFDLTGRLVRLQSLMAPAAEAKGLRFRLEVPAQSLGTLVGDAPRLDQLLLNLIGNAVKFTAQGEVLVRVRPVEGDAARVRLRFEVQDTGIGIAPADLERLFAPFTQADSRLTRRFEGTGLGLSVSHRLARLMGGTIGAESRPGEGSTFWCELTFGRGAPAVGLEAPHRGLDPVGLLPGPVSGPVSGAPQDGPLPSAASPAALDPVQLQALREALERNSAKARHLFKALEPALRDTLGEAVTGALAVAIRDLRFDAALRLLDGGGA